MYKANYLMHRSKLHIQFSFMIIKCWTRAVTMKFITHFTAFYRAGYNQIVYELVKTTKFILSV